MRHRKTENTLALLGGAMLGAAAMYLLDPEAGRRRRETLGDAAGDALRGAGDRIGPAWDTLSERARDISQRLSDRAQSMGSSLSDRAGDARDSIRDTSGDAYDSARGAMGSAFGSARDAVSGWAESLGDWGRNLGRRASRSASDARDSVSDRARRLNPWHEEESHATAYAVAGVTAAAVGAGLIYMLDPTNGRRRRAAAASAVTGVVNNTGRAFRQGGRYVQDMMNRGRGLAHETRRRVAGSREPVSAEQLLQRVRSEMGHVVSHAAAIQVMADGDGVVTLSGRVLASEVDPLLTMVNKVQGVSQVINRLDVQDTVEAVGEQPTAPSQRL